MSGTLIQAGVDCPLAAYFVASGLGATGLTVTLDVWRLRSGTWSEVVTAGSATEVGDGLYWYNLSSSNIAAADVFAYVFKTAGTADQKQVAGSLRVETNWTTTKAGYLTGDAYVRLGAPAGASVSADVAALPASIWNYLSASATTVGSLGKRIVDYLTGDIFGRVGAPAAASVSADIANIYSRIGAPVGASISADIADVPNDVVTALAAQSVTIRTPVLTERSIEVAIGTDYNSTYGNAFTWTIGSTPNLTGFTLTAYFGGVTIADCTITNAGTATQTLTVEPTAAETLQIPQGQSEFSVIAVNTTPNPDVYVALVRGKVMAYTVL